MDKTTQDKIRKAMGLLQDVLDNVDIVVETDAEVDDDIIIEIEDTEYNLSKMSAKEIKEFAKEMFDVKLTGTKKDKLLEDLLEVVTDVDDTEIEEDDVDATEVEEEENVIEKYGIDELDDEELKDILKDADLSTKGKRQSLLDRIAEAIENGEIEVEEDGDEEISDEVEEVEERDENVVKAENKLAEKIKKDISSGKVKQAKIKEFLKSYYDGDAECSDCSGCSKDEMINCFIEINKKLVDDDGAAHAVEEPYVRDGENYCCGKPLVTLDNGNLYCEPCGTEYEE